MNDTNDLWPNFEDVPKITSPRAILAEQANFLSEKTLNLLSANITTSSTVEGKILNRFKIVAPLLQNYSFNLFTLSHNALYYPCELRYNGIIYTLSNEEDLKEKIKEIFNNDETKKIVVSLLGQSKELSE
jgi:hypothetical protein